MDSSNRIGVDKLYLAVIEREFTVCQVTGGQKFKSATEICISLGV